MNANDICLFTQHLTGQYYDPDATPEAKLRAKATIDNLSQDELLLLIAIIKGAWIDPVAVSRLSQHLLELNAKEIVCEKDKSCWERFIYRIQEIFLNRISVKKMMQISKKTLLKNAASFQDPALPSGQQAARPAVNRRLDFDQLVDDLIFDEAP